MASALGVFLRLASSWLKRHLPYRFWRLLHFLSFATFVLVTLHGLLAGSDSGVLWMKAIYAGAAAIVGILTLIRLFPDNQQSRTIVRPR